MRKQYNDPHGSYTDQESESYDEMYPPFSKRFKIVVLVLSLIIAGVILYYYL